MLPAAFTGFKHWDAMLFRGFAVKYLPFTTTAVACANCSLNRLLYRHSQSGMGKAGHLNGLFFPDHPKNCCKIRGLSDSCFFFGYLFWREVLERFWRREKVDYFQYSENIAPSEQEGETRMIGRLLRGGFMTAIYAYLYIPIIILIVNSFNSSRFGINWQGFTTKWYGLLMNNDSLLQAAQHSLTMAVLSATFATLIGSLTAVALYRYRFRGKPFVSGMLFVVMMSPDIVMAISLLVLFMLIGIQLGFWSLLFSHITFCLPFVVVTVYSRLKGFDVRMLEAAKDLGASEVTILRKIILPLAMPAVAAGWLLSFTLSMDDVVVSSFVTGPGYEILPLKIYSMVKVGVSPEVNALATILLVLSLVMVIASQLIARDKTKGR